MYIVTRLISDVHFYITRPKLTFKTYNYRHSDSRMSPKTADYFPSGEVIATLLGNCKVLCYANMNVTLFRVSADQISVFSITTSESVIIAVYMHHFIGSRSRRCNVLHHYASHNYIYSFIITEHESLHKKK